jgi:hypothetical protein
LIDFSDEIILLSIIFAFGLLKIRLIDLSDLLYDLFIPIDNKLKFKFRMELLCNNELLHGLILFMFKEKKKVGIINSKENIVRELVNGIDKILKKKLLNIRMVEFRRDRVINK